MTSWGDFQASSKAELPIGKHSKESTGPGLPSGEKIIKLIDFCLVHVIWTGHRMSKLVLNVKYLLLLSFLIVVEFYNLGHIQGIIRVP